MEVVTSAAVAGEMDQAATLRTKLDTRVSPKFSHKSSTSIH